MIRNIQQSFTKCRSLIGKTLQNQFSQNHSPPKILITGGLGQLGLALAKHMRSQYGAENVILSDIVKPESDVLRNGPYEFADILDFKGLQRLIVNNQVDWLIHFSALLSAVAEQNTALALRVNIEGLHNVLELSKQYQLRLFIPSTIGAFGESSPRNPTPDECIQRPSTIYGVSKVHAELIGEYYCKRFGMDFRSLRLPGVISGDSNPGGGTTDYAVHIFRHALEDGAYKCYLRDDTMLPMIYIDDCTRAISMFMATPANKLQRRVYNLSAFSMTPADVAAEICKHIPHFKIEYQPDFRQQIADTWPQVFDDSNARQDWGWKNDVDLEKLVKIMLEIVGNSSDKIQHEYKPRSPISAMS